MFTFQGSRGIYSPDEGFYVTIASEMIESDSYLIPTLHHVLWLDKPPLTMWGIAVGLKLIGTNEWGARTFHGLCFVLVTILVYLFGRSARGPTEGLLSAVIFATMVLPIAGASVVTPDMPLTLWCTALLFCFWKSVEPNARNGNLWKLGGSSALGLGFLTKGPAALLPLSAIFIFLLLHKRASVIRYFVAPWIIPGSMLFSLIGLGWYMIVANQVPGALDYFWDNQVVGRTVSDKYARNSSALGALIYIPVIIVGALPWSLFWLASLKQTWKRLLQKRAWSKSKQGSFSMFLTAWIAAPLLILCLACSRLPFYVLPLFPALAMITAQHLLRKYGENIRSINQRGFRSGAMIVLASWMLMLIGLKFTSTIYPSKKNMGMLYNAINKELPAAPYEIVSVDEHLEALGFYTGAHIERVTTKKTPYPFFILPAHLNEKIKKMKSTDDTHLFISRNEYHADKLNKKLISEKIHFKKIILPFQRYMFICYPDKLSK